MLMTGAVPPAGSSAAQGSSAAAGCRGGGPTDRSAATRRGDQQGRKEVPPGTVRDCTAPGGVSLPGWGAISARQELGEIFVAVGIHLRGSRVVLGQRLGTGGLVGMVAGAEGEVAHLMQDDAALAVLAGARRTEEGRADAHDFACIPAPADIGEGLAAAGFR